MVSRRGIPLLHVLGRRNDHYFDRDFAETLSALISQGRCMRVFVGG